MSLKGLIENQTIIIDDHKRGSKEIKNWDDDSNDVHIDKTTNYRLEGKRQKVRIRIPINSQRPIKIENAKKEKIDVPSPLKKEIQKALEDENKRKEFITEIIEVLKDFKSSLNNEKRAHQVLTNLSNHFDLDWTGEKISTFIEDNLKAYTEIYKDDKGREYFFKIDNEKIEIGENNGYAKQFKKINRR